MHTGINLSIAINNLTVSYTDDGPANAPSIILIHGFPLNKSMWKNQVEALKVTYRVITYDIRGHGNTEDGTVEFSIELFVRDLISFMDTMKIDKTILCGFSMGGYIALKAVADYPKRFIALILSNTNCTADLPEAIAYRMRSIEILKEGTIGKFADVSLKKLFTNDSSTHAISEIETVREMIVNTSKKTLCNTLLALSAREETCSALAGIKMPVLVLVGEEDIITPPDAARFMHEKIKGSTLHIIEHAGHLSNMEQPVEFNDHLKKFLSTIKPK
jgi:pimeloyl-ACP methyl ester carboxylesterase